MKKLQVKSSELINKESVRANLSALLDVKVTSENIKDVKKDVAKVNKSIKAHFINEYNYAKLTLSGLYGVTMNRVVINELSGVVELKECTFKPLTIALYALNYSISESLKNDIYHCLGVISTINSANLEQLHTNAKNNITNIGDLEKSGISNKKIKEILRTNLHLKGGYGSDFLHALKQMKISGKNGKYTLSDNSAVQFNLLIDALIKCRDNNSDIYGIIKVNTNTYLEEKSKNIQTVGK